MVDELLFGRRPDPLGAASQVAGHLGDDPREALDTVRAALVLPYVALVVDGARGRGVRHAGRRTSGTLPAVRRGTAAATWWSACGPATSTSPATTGACSVSSRRCSPRPCGPARMAEEVQASREGTVTALEEERRRVRRDLHDGLGPRLSGLAFTTDAARNLLRSDPSAADALLAGLRAETVAAIKEVRDIAYGLRPPALDELGLVPAIRQQTTRLRTPDGRPFQVRVDAADLPPLTAAVEVGGLPDRRRGADQRRPAQRRRRPPRRACGATATPCSSRSATTGRRPGRGLPGVGTASMRERAAELGGTVTTTASTAGGTVRALLPLAVPQPR